MKKYIAFLSVGLSLLLLDSCKEKIDITVPDGAPLLVVESEVTTELDSSYVKLTLSSNYFAVTEYPIVTNATVTVNGVPFTFNAAIGRYKAASGYIGKTDTVYNLFIDYNGKKYTSQAKLEPMFEVDSFYQVYKEKEGFLKAGYSLNYIGFDKRSPIKYTYFENGFFDVVAQRDSFGGRKILFDNTQTPLNKTYSFEVPFLRLNSGDDYFAIFRSVDKNMYDFITAFNSQSSGAPGPFKVPPANLPTNIVGGAVGYFATYDVSRWRYRVK